MSATECPSCGFDNRPGALFCGSCGTRLGRPCPACGDVVDPGLAFCTACGAAMAPAPAPTPSAEERKVVTVLFADLVGSTSRAEGADPEDVRRLLDSFHAALKGELERFGGTVEKYIGDAVMALFGAPRAHEDDPERAVRAALALREAVGELNAADPELGLHVRVGITTGEAVVNLGASPAAGESMAAGDVVNTASRLQSAAPVDGILVDESTWRATESAIEYRALEAITPRGRTAAVATWEVVAPRARLGVDIAFRGGARLVGRQRELELLLGALARAEDERAPQLLTLVGEPGIGKSRLLYELYARLHADPSRFVLWRQGRSLPYGEGVSFWALGEMVKAQAGILETDSAEDAAGKLNAAVDAVPAEGAEAAWVLGHLRPLVGLGGEHQAGAGRAAEAFVAWRRFFEAIADQRPLVLVFEDLHWADDDLLDFVDYVADSASGVPLLVVCTARPEFLDRRETWGGGKRNALTVSLSPLSDEETERLVAALLDERRLPPSRTARLLAKAGGNPLYAEEYVRMVTGEAEEELPLPESVQGIIAARLDALPPDEKAVLQDASVVGKVFWPGAVAAVAGLGVEALTKQVRTLERKEFARRERRSSVAGETAYAFRHALVRDVAYSQIPHADRGEKHRLAAAWIESLAGDRPEDLADLAAHHYLSALRYSPAGGEAASGLEERARAALTEAGDRAAALNAFRAAARSYESGLELTPPRDPLRPRLLLRLGRALFYGEDAGMETLAEAHELLLDAGDREGAAEAQTMASELLWLQGRREEAFASFNTSAALLADAPPSRARAYVLATVARFRMTADEAEEAIRVGREAAALADELELRELQAHVLNTIGVARVSLGDAAGLEEIERSVELALSLNSPEVIRGYNNLASTHTALGNLERGFALSGEARRAAERFGRPLALRWIIAAQADTDYYRGDWDAALQRTDEVLDAGDGTRHVSEIDARIVRSLIRLARGDRAGSEEDSDRGLAFAREAQDPQILLPAMAVRASVLAEAGRDGEADDLVREVLERWRATPATFGSSWLAMLAPAALAVGRGPELAEAAAGARAHTRWIEAASALAAGDAVEAARRYAAIGSLPDEAVARLIAGEALAAAGRRAEAEPELTRARSFFERVGAAAYIERLERLPART